MAEAVMRFLVDALKPEQSIYCRTEISLPTFSSQFTFSLFATCSLPTQPNTYCVLPYIQELHQMEGFMCS